MNIKLVNYSIYTVFIFALFGASDLVYEELLNVGTCPKLGVIPACYIIFSCLIFPLIAHIFNKWNYIYFLFTSIALILATYATIGQLIGKVTCPKIESGFPMCYISFAIFSSLVFLKIILIRNYSNKFK